MLISTSGCADPAKELAAAAVELRAAELAALYIEEAKANLSVDLPDMPAGCTEKIVTHIRVGQRLDEAAVRLKNTIDRYERSRDACASWYDKVQEAYAPRNDDDDT